MNNSTRLLVVSAHAADFVWRAAGAIAMVTKAGGIAKVLALSYGERGESGELWKEPGQTEEKVKTIRRAEGEQAAAILGASFEGMDLGDYPLELDRSAIERLSGEIREFAPTIILTHTKEDPFNPDHGVAYSATEKARQLAAGAGVASAFQTVRRSRPQHRRTTHPVRTRSSRKGAARGLLRTRLDKGKPTIEPAGQLCGAGSKRNAEKYRVG